ncbi:type I glyceraldehyde-3-phosphate dehydrogenase [Aliidiomarina sedimenti]|uniref:Glyceraldehyde-3-phosphate dehydrogenase n=1 Tax=Aliidiomarina sedimenti TaxID=1933879 RepID=A0ABY0BZC4_9GAMM|nr:ArsJ-associated glyceraldehyde-3-phosphate dehydrogenase [Aliidiomarina sedimenti]RUO29974.1 type I glyceraldehyde-3-phosphate dehydrogenase [Aliidiomarina sedimenti]
MSKKTVKVGINGFGRIGRLALRAGFGADNIEFVQINDPGADAATMAHLLEFDSVHGRWGNDVKGAGSTLKINGREIHCTAEKEIKKTDWSGCDLVIEASGANKTADVLQAYLDQGVEHVVVTAPVKSDGVPNIVVGVNDEDFDPKVHTIVTAASCTTNCLAPVVKVVKDNWGIKHGSMTTIHALTNTQTILDAPHKDLRRARACGMSLIPTTTGSAKAITAIFPELSGKINGHAVRVPLECPSLTDMVFELEKPATVDEVNAAFATAAAGELEGILGYEERPLVSIDYKTDPRSSIVDALSTMVINGTQLKVYAWYDNEWGYSMRVVDLVKRIAQIQ